MTGTAGWGIFREVAHSPGRETDDEQILALTAKELEARGLPVVLKTPEEVVATGDERPRFVFCMCERLDVLERLRAWEAQGIPHVNSPHGVLNTYRDRMIARFEESGVPFVASRLVGTAMPAPAVPLPAWVKRADVHNTRDGDVVYAETADGVQAALAALAGRGIARAVLQPHIPGDLVKFYGIGAAREDGDAPWFRWFYHQHQRLSHHPFEPARLAILAARAAAALGLDIYGGDAIATAGGGLVLLDVNAWPSFARFRDEAAARIAVYLASRFERGVR